MIGLLMKRAVQLTAAVCAAVGVSAAAQAPSANETPGALLYKTHCVTCHTTQVHWRERKLVTDWASLDAQVRRWQNNIGLRWTDEDVTAVTRYLNTAYYRFRAPDSRAERPGNALRAVAAKR